MSRITINLLWRILTVVIAILVTSGCSFLNTPVPDKLLRHVVKRGETLAEIARGHNISLSKILAVNEIEDPNYLEIGQVVFIPNPRPSSNRERPDAKQFMTAREAGVTSPRPLTRSEAQKIVGPLVWPVVGGRLSSPFGNRSGKFHEGLDIRAAEGTEVLAAHAGTVAYAGDEWQGYGNMIVISSPGYCTVYAHNNRNLVSEGDIVDPGQQIATVGMTGTASGPHVHFEVRVDRENGFKSAIDPLALQIKKYSQQMAKNAPQ